MTTTRGITVQRDPDDTTKDGWIVIEHMHPTSLILKRGTRKECEDYVRVEVEDRRTSK